MAIHHYLAIGALTAYLLATIFFIFLVLGRANRLTSRARYFFYAGFLLQTLLFIPFVEVHSAAIPESRGEYMFWFAWAIALSYLMAGRYADYPLVGAFAAPLSALFLSASSYLSHQSSVSLFNRGQKTLLFMHVLPAVLSELCLLLALMVSSVYLVQSRRIKKKLSSALSDSAPSLSRLESINQKVLLVGFLSMTAAIISGVLWGISAGENLLGGDFYQWLAVIVWLITAGLLHARLNLQCSASRMAKLTVCSGLLLLIGMLLAGYFQGNFIHSYAV